MTFAYKLFSAISNVHLIRPWLIASRISLKESPWIALKDCDCENDLIIAFVIEASASLYVSNV